MPGGNIEAATPRAQTIVSELAEGEQQWSIPWPCVYESISVVTNPRIWKEQVTSPSQALAQVRAWLNSPSVRLLAETADFYEILEPLANRPKVRGQSFTMQELLRFVLLMASMN